MAPLLHTARNLIRLVTFTILTSPLSTHGSSGDEMNCLSSLVPSWIENSAPLQQNLAVEDLVHLSNLIKSFSLRSQKDLEPQALELLAICDRLTLENSSQDLNYSQFGTDLLLSLIEFFQTTLLLNSSAQNPEASSQTLHRINGRVYCGLAKLFAEAARRSHGSHKMIHIRAAMVSNISASISLENSGLPGSAVFFEAPLMLIESIIEAHSHFTSRDLMQVRDFMLPLLIDESLLRMERHLDQDQAIESLLWLRKIVLRPGVTHFPSIAERIEEIARRL
jgi:hypothetical protein